MRRNYIVCFVDKLPKTLLSRNKYFWKCKGPFKMKATFNQLRLTTAQMVLKVVSPVSSINIIRTLVRNANFQASFQTREWETDGRPEEGVQRGERISEGNMAEICVLTKSSLWFWYAIKFGSQCCLLAFHSCISVIFFSS